MPHTIVISVMDSGTVSVSDYPGLHSHQLGIHSKLKDDCNFFQSAEEALEKISQLIKANLTDKLA